MSTGEEEYTPKQPRIIAREICQITWQENDQTPPPRQTRCKTGAVDFNGSVDFDEFM